MTEITWDRPKLKRLQRAYESAKTDVFEFEGAEFVRGYAKYLIEYLDGILIEQENSNG